MGPLIDAIAGDVVLASGVVAGSPRTHPVESPVVAIARPVFTAVGGCPQVGDTYALPALHRGGAPRSGGCGAGICSSSGDRRTGPPRHDRGRGPELSIVIPTLDAAGERSLVSAAIACTTPETHEVIVVDTGSSPGYTAP